MGLRLWHWEAEGCGDPNESLAKPGDGRRREGHFQHHPGFRLQDSRGQKGYHPFQESTYPNGSSEAGLPGAEQPPGAARFLLQLF